MSLFLLLMQVFTTHPVDPRFGVAGAAITHDRAFGMPELTEFTASARWTMLTLPLEAGLSTFGFELYRETRLRGGVGVGQGDLRAALLLEARVLSVRGFAPVVRRAVSAKAQLPLGAGVQGGLLLENLNAAPDVPQVWAAGISRTLHGPFSADAVLWKDVAFPADARVRLRWSPHPAIEAELGRSTDPARWSGALRLRTGSIRVGFHFRDHPWLGWSSAQEVEWLW